MLKIGFTALSLVVAGLLGVSVAKADNTTNAAPAARGQEPGWMGVIVARGELKQEIKSMPMVDRPYRPFHFYGNTVRREYYHGTRLPAPRKVLRGDAPSVNQNS